MSWVRPRLLAVALATAISPIASAQQSPLPIDVLLTAPTLPLLSMSSIAPDSRAVAYTVIETRRRPPVRNPGELYRTGVSPYALAGDIWVGDLEGGRPRNVTLGRGSNWLPSWSPDGQRIAFLSDRGHTKAKGFTQLWVWERATNTLRPVSNIPLMDPRGPMLEWTRDSRAVLVKAFPEGMSPTAYADKLIGNVAADATHADTGVTVKVFRSKPAQTDSISRTEQINLNRWLGDLALIDVATGVVRRLSRDVRVYDYKMSPDRRKVVWAAAKRTAPPGSQQVLLDLTVLDLGTGRERLLVADAPLVATPTRVGFSWSPTSQAVAYRTNGPALAPDETFVVNVDGELPRRIAVVPSLEEPREAEQPLWDAKGRKVVFQRDGALWQAPIDGGGAVRVVTSPSLHLELVPTCERQFWSVDGGRSAVVFATDRVTKRMSLARVELTSGTVTPVFEEAKHYGGYHTEPLVSADGNLVLFVAEDPSNPPDLWLARADDHFRRQQVSHIAPMLRSARRDSAEVITWRAVDGDTLRGALLYPTEYESGRRFPLIVWAYGGTDVSDDLYRFGYASTLIDNRYVLTSRGYTVLLADSKLHVGTPMRDLLTSIMPGIDQVIDRGIADPFRIGMLGHSYGGYNVLSMITQSTRFRAAVMRAGFGDLFGIYGQLSPDGTSYGLPWAETGQGRMGGTPWQFRDRYIENSPAFYLDKVTTPLLIVHGADDLNVQPHLAEQVFVGLRRLGRRVEYARYSREGHWEGDWSRPNQIDYLTRMISWFGRYLKGPQGTADMN